jgi:glutamate dehydrogenase
MLVELFEARFDPARGATDEELDAIRARIVDALTHVRSLDQDQILRHMLGTIRAIVRTNAYLADRSYLAFKLRSAEVPEMVKPFPLYEIFVYSAELEAIHLRGGLVARGGIRWSDRLEDYRTAPRPRRRN